MRDAADYPVHSFLRRCPQALSATRFYKGASAPMRDLFRETSDELRAKAQLAPTIYGTEAQFDPLYAGLNNRLLAQSLFGDEGGPTTFPSPGYDNANSTYQDAVDAFNRSFTTRGGPGHGRDDMSSPVNVGGGISRIGSGGRGNILRVPRPIAPTLSPTTTINPGRTPGISEIISRLGDRLTTANTDRWKNLSPAALAAIKASNPQLAGLIDTMMSQSQNELDMGGNLNPAMLRQVQQSVRSRQAGMLGGTGNAGDYGEALGISQFGQGLRQQRFANAGTAAGLSDSIYSPKLAALMGDNYDWRTILGLGTSMSQGGPRLFGSTVNANDVFSSNQNAAAANSAARSQRSDAMTGAGISAGAGILSALVGLI